METNMNTIVAGSLADGGLGLAPLREGIIAGVTPMLWRPAFTNFLRGREVEA